MGLVPCHLGTPFHLCCYCMSCVLSMASCIGKAEDLQGSVLRYFKAQLLCLHVGDMQHLVEQRSWF